MESDVGPLTRAFLKRCGYGDVRIGEWNGKTRLLQDIHLVGDSAWDEFTIMHRVFGVDLSGFKVDRYFPPELSIARLMVTSFSWTRYGKNILKRYPEITLDMIEQVLEEKKWRFA